MIREALTIVLNENVNPQILKLAEVQGADSTDKLRALVAQEYGIHNPPPKMSSNVKTVPQLIKAYEKLLKTHNAEMKILFDIVPKGVGRAEVMLAFVHDEISIGGGSQNYDVDYGSIQLEVKEVKISGDYGGNFRLGVDSTHYLKRAYDDIAALYGVARYYIPEIDNDDFANNVYKKGGIALAQLRKWVMPKKIEVKDVELKVLSDGYMFHDGAVIGNISDKSLLGKIADLFKVPKKVKSFSEIEDELESGLSGHEMKYLFFGDLKKGIPMYYKDRIKDIRIESATGHKVKFQIKLK